MELRDLRLVGVQAFVLRRDFARGAVVVNPTDTVQRTEANAISVRVPTAFREMAVSPPSS